MRLLPGTNLPVWAAEGDARLSPNAIALLTNPANSVAFSVVSIWETTSKYGLNRTDFSLHRDPFDRLLLAQATVEGLTLLTADATLARYPGPVRLV